MATFLTPPTYAQGKTYTGDFDLFNGLNADNGDGTLYARNGGLYIAGLSALNQVSIHTDNGLFDVTGSNKVRFDVTDTIEYTAQNASFFTCTDSTLTLSAINSVAGKVTIQGSGEGNDSVLIQADNATSGQITLTSAGASTSVDAIRILATDTTDGNILIQGSGSFGSSNPSIKLYADNATSGQISITSAGGSSSVDAIQITATDTTEGNVLIKGYGSYTSSIPAVQIEANNATSGQILLTSAGASTSVDAIKIIATDTTDGNVVITGSGNYAATNPAVLINAPNTASGQIRLTSAGASTTVDAIQILATNSTDGNVLIKGSGNFSASNPAITLQADNATSGQILITSASGASTNAGVAIKATDTTNGQVLIQGSGSHAAGNPAIKLYTDNATSGQIELLSASDSTSVDAILLSATGTTGGLIHLQSAGGTAPSINLDATSTTGQVLVQSAHDSTSQNSIKLLASGTTEGNVLIQGRGTNTNNPAIKLLSDNTTSGQVLIQANGNISNAVRILANNATNGGIDIDAIGGTITIDTTNTTNGISIGTATAGVPVTIGTSSSLTTIAGNLIVQGTTTTMNSEVITVEDNTLLLNSGNGELGLDSGVTIRRFQTPNDAGTGDVVTNPNPIQESGAFQAGSATPGTLVLAAHSSSVDDFYKGWWIKVTSGTGVDQVRRIKSYVGSTQTATLYVTADNTNNANGPAFTDGLDLTTAPAAADTYQLYSDSFVSTYFNESGDAWTIGTSPLEANAISASGTSLVPKVQYKNQNTGSVDIYPLVYDNVHATASTTTITINLRGHGQSVGDKVYISNSSGLTPSLTTGAYVIQTVATNTFTITAAASTTSTSASSVTVKLMKTSVLYTNEIRLHDSSYGSIVIPGLTATQDISIPKTDTTTWFSVNLITTTYGCYTMLVGDLNNNDGCFAIFSMTNSSGVNGSVTRQDVTKGTDGQRIQARWNSGLPVQIKHDSAGSGVGSYTYRVKVISLF